MVQGAPSIFSTKPWEPPRPEYPTLFERYQVLGILGEGGMGTVFKGFHVNLKRHVAFKTMRLDRAERPDLVKRFLREMEIVGQMDHPNVVRATDAGQKNGVFYLVMEYLSGLDLARLLAKTGRLDVPHACELVRQAALGLDYIHRTLVHRDIKPSNLMLTKDGLVKILDLGLARCSFGDVADQERTPSGCALGTYAYMAPEQAISGADADGRADIYSLGCTLFKLLSGQAPFSGAEYENAARLLLAHRQIPLSDVEGFTAIPEALRPLLLRMTAKDPRQRLQSACDAVQELTPFAAGGQPRELLKHYADESQDSLRPLSQPLPEILSQLAENTQETPRQTHTVSAGQPRPAPRRRLTPFRMLLAVGLVAASLAAAWTLLSRPREQPREEAPPEKKPAEAPAPTPSPPTEPSVFSLPLAPTPLRSLDVMKPVLNHDLLKQPAFPPEVIGFRQGDGLASGTWVPGEEKLELNPTGTLLVQMATTSKKRPGYTFQTRLLQRPWSGNVGLFWGYQEDLAIKSARQPGKAFAHFQLLHVSYTNSDKMLQFYIARARVSLQHTSEGRVAVLNMTNIARHDLPSLTDERIFMIEIRNGKLASAVFGATVLTKVVTEEANKEFQPADYPGSFGVFTRAAHVTIRTPSVLPHSDN